MMGRQWALLVARAAFEFVVEPEVVAVVSGPFATEPLKVWSKRGR